MDIRTRTELDARFLKTEKLILASLTKFQTDHHGSPPTITELCKIADIKTSTFYRHYSSIDDIFIKYQDEIMADFTRYLRKTKTSGLPDKITKILYFVLKNYQKLSVIPRRELMSLFSYFVGYLRYDISRLRTGIPAQFLSKILNMLAYELFGLARIWKSFDNLNLDLVLKYRNEFLTLIMFHMKT